MKYILIALSLVLFSACSSKNIEINNQDPKIQKEKSLETLPENKKI